MGRGKLYIVGLGPGDSSHLTARAKAVLEDSEIVLGYRTYLDLISDLLEGKEVIASGMREEVDRAKAAVEAAASGRIVSVVSSGDPGIYGMAGLIFEILKERGWSWEDQVAVEVVPGVSALNAAASLLGAPLMNDFAAISLSDLLTPWEVVARRLDAAAGADFVLVLYNPSSKGRKEQLSEALRIISRYRPPGAPVGLVRNGYREGQRVTVTDLGHIPEDEIDMLTTVVVGSSTTFTFDGLMVTPRGYAGRYDLKAANKITGAAVEART